MLNTKQNHLPIKDQLRALFGQAPEPKKTDRPKREKATPKVAKKVERPGPSSAAPKPKVVVEEPAVPKPVGRVFRVEKLEIVR